ncbi:YlcI/YnfO family protein [Enterobacter chuandaensis]|nr:YlcI/YnfO family protein [Enterobacter chuandaensis]MCW4780835.1 YlcI/YnfO family protein [Enterobacter chuandaensis]MDA4758683.1 YlcI/YnfO family protein [Enterobacter chuandaensis]
MIRFEYELLNQIDILAGEGNFSSWVKEVYREKLRKSGIDPKGQWDF